MQRYDALDEGMEPNGDGDYVFYSDVQDIIEDARRFRWLLDGHGYFMEEEMLCGHDSSDAEKDHARQAIDDAMREK